MSQLEQARSRASHDDLLVAERELVSFAAEAAADDVRRLAIRWRDALDVDGIEPREEALVAARSLKRMVLPNGMKRFVLDLDPLSAAYLDTAIDAEVTATIRSVRFADLNSPAGLSGGSDDCMAADSSPVHLGADLRTLAQMGADVVVDLAHHTLSCEHTTPALAAATVVVRMSADALVSGLGEAQIDCGEQPISAGTARRLAAEGGIIPMVLVGDSEVLDLGRRRRTFTRAHASPAPSATAAAPCPDAIDLRRTPRRTTSTGGSEITARPISTPVCFSAPETITECTRRDGRSGWRRAACGSSPRRASIGTSDLGAAADQRCPGGHDTPRSGAALGDACDDARSSGADVTYHRTMTSDGPSALDHPPLGE